MRSVSGCKELPKGLSVTKGELKEEIISAFKDAPVPLRIAGDPDYWEALEAEQSFKGRKWSEITTENARYYPLSLLGPAGWRYYMPAYLLASLDDLDLLDTTIHTLRVRHDVSN